MLECLTNKGAGLVVIVWLLDLQLSVQSVPLSTNLCIRIPFKAICTRYNINII